MGKGKLQKFAEMDTFDNVFHAPFEKVLNKDFDLKGQWHSKYFGNNNPIVLELGCGKGDYTVGLGRMSANKNFIGIDIKGARMWRGAKTAIAEGLKNIAFVRTRIEFIPSFFAPNEVQEIWLTFSDPQPHKARKRLSSPQFLNRYRKFLQHDSLVHVKTDNVLLHQYSLDVARHNNLNILYATTDLYASSYEGEAKQIQTFYEQMFLAEGKKITYLLYRLPADKTIEEPPYDVFKQQV